MKTLGEYLFESVKTIELAQLADQLKKYKGHDNWDKLIDLQYLFKDIKIDQITPDMVEVVDTTPKTITAARKMIKNKDGFIITINKDNEFDCIMLEDRYCGIPNRENTGENYWSYAKISELAAEMKSSTKMMFIHSAQFAEILSKEDKSLDDMWYRNETIKRTIEAYEKKSFPIEYKHKGTGYGSYEIVEDKIENLYKQLENIFDVKYKKLIAKLKVHGQDFMEDVNFYNLVLLLVDIYGWSSVYYCLGKLHKQIGNKDCPYWPSWYNEEYNIQKKDGYPSNALTLRSLCNYVYYNMYTVKQINDKEIKSVDEYLQILDIVNKDFAKIGL